MIVIYVFCFPINTLSDIENPKHPFFIGITSSSNLTSAKSGSVVPVNDQISSSNYIPYCSMSNAQLSFHGYRDAVKFFVAVPGQAPSKLLHSDETTSESLLPISSASPFGDILVVSGGDGYIDFRLGNKTAETNNDATNSNKHISYLIVWHLGSA
jgi:hypothetical protein